MEFKGTKGKLFSYNNSDGTIAIVSKELNEAIAFLPEFHKDTNENLKLFKSAPEMFELLSKINKQKIFHQGTFDEIRQLLTKITE